MDGFNIEKNTYFKRKFWQLYINKPVVLLLGIDIENVYVKLEISQGKLFISKSDKNAQGALVKKLIKRGSGFGLNFDIPILELLNIDPEKDMLNIEYESGSLIIKK